MKNEMKVHFVPEHYKRDQFNKIQRLTQGDMTVEDYYKVMEKSMIRGGLSEPEESTMVRFLKGLHRSTQHIIEFHPYNIIVELVHQATKVEHQMDEDKKLDHSSSYTTPWLSNLWGTTLKKVKSAWAQVKETPYSILKPCKLQVQEKPNDQDACAMSQSRGRLFLMRGRMMWTCLLLTRMVPWDGTKLQKKIFQFNIKT